MSKEEIIPPPAAVIPRFMPTKLSPRITIGKANWLNKKTNEQINKVMEGGNALINGEHLQAKGNN